MIFDLDQKGRGELLEYDLCVIGTGPAGGTLAAELADSGLRICVLECGLARVTKRGDELRRVESEGIQIKDYSRERVLGGSSTTWAGLAAPLDRIDLEPRPWLEHSGWPIPREELEGFYAQAAERYRFPPEDLFGERGFGALRAKGTVQPDWAEVEEKIFLAPAEPQNFGKEQRQVYEGEAIDLYLDATVLRLEADPASARVTAAVVRTRSGKQHRFHARAFAVATGGLENARLLLNSPDLCPAGLGNERDRVGRYLMNHPKNYHGILRLTRPVEDLPYFFGCMYEGYAGYAGLRLSEDRQAAGELLNCYVRFEPLFPWSDSRGVEALVLLVKRSAFLMRSFVKRKRGKVVELRDYSETGDDSDLQNARKTPLEWLGLVLSIPLDARRVFMYLWYRLVARAKPKIRRVRLRNFMEMEPDAENRVLLGERRDLNEEAVPVVRHDSTARDRRSLLALHAALVEEFDRGGIGKLETDLEGETPWPICQDASHHLGTTRMGTDPETSVCDPDGKVHSVANLYMAGGSLFPTSGCANPTFTIVALSIRLARHLAHELQGAETASAGR